MAFPKIKAIARAGFVVLPFLTTSLLAKSVPEYQIKAAFLYNFVRFTQWPETPEHKNPTNNPIIIGITGGSSIVDIFKDALDGQIVGNRRITVKPFHMGTDTNWNVVFLPLSSVDEMDAVLKSLRGSQTLTVGETSDFLERGGMIDFLLENNKVRFAVNIDAINQAGLKIDSQMLQYAQSTGKN